MEAQRTLIFIVAATLVLLSSCLAKTTVIQAGTASVGQIVIDDAGQQDLVRGSGRRGSVERELPPFERIVIRVAATVRVATGAAPSVTLQGDDNLLSLLETRVHEDVLYLETERSFAPQLPLTIALTTPSLRTLEQWASGEVELQNMRGNQLALVLAGAGRLQASGQVDKLEAELTGSGEMRMQELRSKQAVVRIGGAGNVHVHAEQSLHAVITGAGSITYLGNPRVEKQILGAGSVTAAHS